MDEVHFQFIKDYLPKFLSPEQKENLFSLLKSDFPYSTKSEILYSILDNTSIFYQGDGIEDVIFGEFNEAIKCFESYYQSIPPTNYTHHLI